MLRTKRKRHKNEKSGYWGNTMKGALKWHSNLMVRSRNRAQLHKIMRDPEHEYDPSHDRYKKMLWWVYD